MHPVPVGIPCQHPPPAHAPDTRTHLPHPVAGATAGSQNRNAARICPVTEAFPEAAPALRLPIARGRLVGPFGPCLRPKPHAADF